MYKILFTSAFLILIHVFTFSQVPVPAGEFSKDSLKIGEEVDYSLSIRYPRNIDIVFPDSNYSFEPFEYLGKESFPTKSDSLFSFDSAVYTLTTFEIDSVQMLNLPIFMVTAGDSVAIEPRPDSIVLVHIVKSIPDSIAMIENTEYSNVKLGFNYPYLIAGVTILVITIIVVILVFGKSIRKKIQLYRLKKMHERFLTKFNSAIKDPDPDNIEHLLVDWKGYMEKLNRTPYTKLTSKEIHEVYQDRQLRDSLQSIDKAIYGGLKTVNLPGSFDYLRRISEDSFHNKVEEIKNG